MTPAPPWLDILDETIRACVSHDRPDLADVLRTKRSRLLDPRLRVLVIGESNQGKSQLVNALVNAPVCPVGDDITTTSPTMVRYADAPENTEDLGSAAEIGIPRKLLASGLVLVDTPASDLIPAPRTEASFAAPAESDAVLLASDATRELSTSELDLLGSAAKSGPAIIVALTKIDIAPRWRQVAERTRSLLATAGIPATLIPVSAAVRLQAAATGNKALNDESGFPELIGCLQRTMVHKGDVLARHAVAMAASVAIASLVTSLRDELTSRNTGGSAAVAMLQAAQQRLDDLRRQTTRWQTVLADEIADLTSDVDYDLRERTRKILREADRAFDTADPGATWDSLSDWVREVVADCAEANFGWLVERFTWVVEKVANTFPMPEGETLPASLTELSDHALDGMVEIERPPLDSFTLGQKAFTFLRNSYGGLLMFGLATSIAGLEPIGKLPVMINPISVGAGIAFGGKGVRDESESRLKRRQALAKNAVNRYVDDFYLRFAKDCKDILRHAHRNIRDHFTALTERLQDEAIAAATAARQALQAEAVRQDLRTREIQRQLDELVALHRRVSELATPVGALTATPSPAALPRQPIREITS